MGGGSEGWEREGKLDLPGSSKRTVTGLKNYCPKKKKKKELKVLAPSFPEKKKG